jgi:hypothetical protein
MKEGRRARGDKAKGDTQTSGGKTIDYYRSLFTDFFVLCLLK